MNSEQSERIRILVERTSRMMRAWSPALRDQMINIYINAVEERRHLSDEDVNEILGFDPCKIEELKPPWRNPEF